MSPAQISKLKALASHPATPIHERESAANLLRKIGISLKKPSRPIIVKADVSDAALIIHPWSEYKNDPIWGLGCEGCGFKYIVIPSIESDRFAFVEYEDALKYAQKVCTNSKTIPALPKNNRKKETTLLQAVR